MIQSPKETFINICKPTYFYNVSQRHNFLVYDFRPTVCTQRLKWTFKLDTVGQHQQLRQLQTSNDLLAMIVPQDHESERKNIENLFKARKRNFSFFLPFNATDQFCLYLSEYLYELEEQKENLNDFVKVTIENLLEVCSRYREMGPNLVKQHKPVLSPQLMKTDSTNSNMIGQESASDLGRYNAGILWKHYWSSTPNLLEYNILDQEIQNLDVFETMLHVVRVFKQEKHQELYLLLEPANILFQYYPMLDYAQHRNKKFLDRTLPNEIVEGKMYLGNAEHAMNEDMLVNVLRITHIVNAAKEVKSPIEGVMYLKVNICDEVTEEIFKHFEEVYDFIESVWDREDCRILIHCAQGRSRSAALVIMFLMRKNKWTLEIARHYVEERREVVSVNDGFLSQLERYEKKIL